MPNTPNITRRIFDASKRYLGQVYQPDRGLHHWDTNETSDELVWFICQTTKALAGGDGRIESNSGFGLQPSPTAPESSNISLTAGYAVVNGRPVIVDNDFLYDDAGVANYIVKGTVSTVTEISAGTLYGIVDEEKLFSADYSLPSCRVIMTSGAENGNQFTITSLDGQQVRASGDMSGVLAGDTYIIAPPAITALGGVTPVHLVTWFEDISGVEDPILVDPSEGTTPSHRRELRWCLHLNWAGFNSGSVLDGHQAIEVFTLDLTDATVVASDIVDGEYIRSLMGQDIPDRVSAVETEVDQLQVATSGFSSEDTQFRGSYGFWKQTSSSASIQLVDGYSLFVPALDDPTYSELYKAELPETTFANTVIQSSHFRLAVNTTGNGFDGDLIDNKVKQYSASNPVLPARHTNLLSIEADNNGGDPQIKRMFPMGDIPRLQGMDWIVYQDGSNKSPVHIQPGQLQYRGFLYQNVDEYIISDARDIAYHINGSITNGWNYLYARTTTDTRSLTYGLDATEPKWNGEHPSERSMCIGIMYITEGRPHDSICRSGNIKFGTPLYLKYDATTGEPVLNDIINPAESLDVFPPAQAKRIVFKYSTFTGTNIFTLTAVPDLDVLNTEYSYENTTTVIARDFDFELPAGQADYQITLLGIDQDCTIELAGFDFEFGYMPDHSSWRF